VTRTRRADDDRDSGHIAVFMVGITLALLAVVGLGFDGGAALIARGRAYDLAAQAARAGANAITPESLRSGETSELRVDPVAAQAAAQRLLNAAGATGTVTIPERDVVVVTAHVPKRTAILGIVGIHDVSGTATASATILHGTSIGERR
jgi:CRISPR-associated Cas5-like protein